MKKLIFTLLMIAFTLLISNSSFAQTDYSSIKAQAEESSRAYLSDDYGKLADYTYPRVIELMGGRERMIAFVKKSTDDMKAEGITFISHEVTAPTKVEIIGKQKFAILPVTLQLKAPGGRIVQNSFMIGISDDGGNRWTFIDGAGVDAEKMKILIPSAAGKLVIPERQQPVFHRET